MLVVSLSKYTLTESQGYTFTGLSEKQRSLLLDLILNVLICSYNFTLNPNPPENAPAINAPPGLTELNFRQATGDIISNLYLESGKYAEVRYESFMLRSTDGKNQFHF